MPAFASPTINILNALSLLNSFPHIDVKIEPIKYYKHLKSSLILSSNKYTSPPSVVYFYNIFYNDSHLLNSTHLQILQQCCLKWKASPFPSLNPPSWGLTVLAITYSWSWPNSTKLQPLSEKINKIHQQFLQLVWSRIKSLQKASLWLLPAEDRQ